MTSSIAFDAYASYGLRQSPFMVTALRPNEVGRRLLIGRDDRISLVAQAMHMHGKITCLDGHVGVGKTSLANVAAFECFDAFLRGDTPQLLVPMEDPVQLDKDQSVDAFCTSVFRRVAQTLLRYREQFRDFSHSEAIATRLAPWLNSPIVQHVSSTYGFTGSVGVPHVGAAGLKGDVSTSTQLNTTGGFADQGFEQLVRTWLDQIFSVQGNGGVVCVIDNLELLETGAEARRKLESLRDRLFTVNGIRWVFCGANGVIHSLAASTRLNAFLNRPIMDVQHISPGAVVPMMRARLHEFAMTSAQDAEERLPITLEDLDRLYMVVNFNLRDLLATAEAFCNHVHSTGKKGADDAIKQKRFDKWIKRQTADSYETLSKRLHRDAWSILDFAMSDECKGTFGFGNYQEFNRNNKLTVSAAQFERWIKDLVKLEILSKPNDDHGGDQKDEEAFKRLIFTVTAKGSIAHYARILKSETQTLFRIDWLKRAIQPSH